MSRSKTRTWRQRPRWSYITSFPSTPSRTARPASYLTSWMRTSGSCTWPDMVCPIRPWKRSSSRSRRTPRNLSSTVGLTVVITVTSHRRYGVSHYRLFVQQLVSANTQNIKPPHYWLLMEIHWLPVDAPQKAQNADRFSFHDDIVSSKVEEIEVFYQKYKFPDCKEPRIDVKELLVRRECVGSIGYRRQSDGLCYVVRCRVDVIDLVPMIFATWATLVNCISMA